MMFCPKCGSLLVPKINGKKKTLVCSCGFKEKDVSKARITEVIGEKKSVEVVETELDPYPLTTAECPKCKHKKARYWTVQTRAGDESETKFFKCESCKHTWRDYS